MTFGRAGSSPAFGTIYVNSEVKALRIAVDSQSARILRKPRNLLTSVPLLLIIRAPCEIVITVYWIAIFSL